MKANDTNVIDLWERRSFPVDSPTDQSRLIMRNLAVKATLDGQSPEFKIVQEPNECTADVEPTTKSPEFKTLIGRVAFNVFSRMILGPKVGNSGHISGDIQPQDVGTSPNLRLVPSFDQESGGTIS